jgi:transposase
LPGGEKETEKWSTRDKFAIVVETASLSEVEAWRDACMQANGGVAQQASRLQRELKQKEREKRELARELQRKDVPPGFKVSVD